MFLSNSIHSNSFFQPITQSFYLLLSQNSIRTRNEISAGVLIIRRRKKLSARGPWEKIKKNLKKSHSAEKNVTQCQK